MSKKSGGSRHAGHTGNVRGDRPNVNCAPARAKGCVWRRFVLGKGNSKEERMAVYANQTIIKYGVGFGSALAMSVSFALNKSIGWAIIHGLLGWFYVVYAWLFKAY
jgi:hypothetical protein